MVHRVQAPPVKASAGPGKRVQASGLDPNLAHAQHIHGVPDGNSVTPAASQDTDGDGFIELSEEAATYGPIVLSLTDDTVSGLGGFPTAPGCVLDDSFENPLFAANPSYNTALPVLAGEVRAVTPVPLPAAGLKLLAGLGAFGSAAAEAERTTGPAQHVRAATLPAISSSRIRWVYPRSQRRGRLARRSVIRPVVPR